VSQSIHDFHDDARNAAIRIWVNGALVPRAEAVVSVFDSGFVLGDGVWEGLRVVGGHPAFLDAHLDRLYEGAKAIALDIGLTRAQLTQALYATLAANGMHGDGVHVRLMVTRGVKRTPYQDPRATIGAATVVIIAEWKTPKPETLATGLTLFTVHVRRGYPDVQDPKLNSHSKLNCITACIQATAAGADEALMLDPQGYVAEGTGENIFVVKNGVVRTPPTSAAILAGITRDTAIALLRERGVEVREEGIARDELYTADEVFLTGTAAEITPVREIDHRKVGRPGPVTRMVQDSYLAGVRGEIEAGGALALRRKPEQAWSVCIVRWVRSDCPGQVEVGLQIIGQSFHPVMVGFRGRAVQQLSPALALPIMEPLRRHPAMLAVAGTYASRRFVFVRGTQTVYVAQARALGLDLQTPSVELFQYEIDPYPI